MFVDSLKPIGGFSRPREIDADRPSIGTLSVRPSESVKAVAVGEDRLDLAAARTNARNKVLDQADRKEVEISMSDDRLALIHDRIASGYYDRAEIIEAVLNGVIADIRDLLPDHQP